MIPATDDRLTIEPPPLSFIARTASRQPRNVPSALTALTLRKSASVVVSTLPSVPMPALLTRMSRRPKAASTASTTSRQRASSVTSCARVRSASDPSVFEAGFIAVGRRDLRALAVEQRRRRPADAGRRAGDERDLAAKSPRSHILHRPLPSRQPLSREAGEGSHFGAIRSAPSMRIVSPLI